MARYSLFVLKVPLNTNQPTNLRPPDNFVHHPCLPIPGKNLAGAHIEFQ